MNDVPDHEATTRFLYEYVVRIYRNRDTSFLSFVG